MLSFNSKEAIIFLTYKSIYSILVGIITLSNYV
jgi:hypothetical protein